MHFSDFAKLVQVLPLLLFALLTGCAHRVAVSNTTLASLPASTLLLSTLEGEPMPLEALTSTADATVLVFFSTTCPCVKRYQQRVEALAQQFPADRVRVFLVSSNSDDDRETLVRVRSERQLSLPLLVDWSGHLAQGLGVRTTPTTIVLDRAGAVRYRGWVDNERLPEEEGREPYVEHAIAGLLAGKSDFAAAAPVFGCTITRRLNGERTRPIVPVSANQPCH